MAMLSYDEAIHIANVQYTLVKSQNIVPFLDMALRFPEYAKENICLLMVQDPEEVTEFRTQREWLECGTHLLPDVRPITLALFKSQSILYVFDVSQTDQQRSLLPPNAEKAYHALIQTLGQEPVELEESKNRVAYYDLTEKQWYVNLKSNHNARFRSIAAILVSKLLEKETGIDAIVTTDMVVYMLCKKYGISPEGINLKAIQDSLRRITDTAIADNSIRMAMHCMTIHPLRDLDAYYQGQIKQLEMERKQQAEQEALQAEQQKQAEEKRIQEIAEKRAAVLAEEMVKEKLQAYLQSVPEKKSFWEYWKRGGTS